MRQRTINTTKLDSQGPLHLGENLGTRDSLSGLVILDDRGLLVDLLCEFLLCQLLVPTGSLDGLWHTWRMSDLERIQDGDTHLAYGGIDLGRWCDLVLTIEFRYSLVIRT